MTFKRDLQGLRAIAIFLVVLGHSGLEIMPGGFVGVDVFFVLSGYLISKLLLQELEQTGRIAFIAFYARRLKRLLPALVLMLGITSGAAIWLLSAVEARVQLASSPFAATWTSNLYFAFANIKYFDELATRDLFLHTWSLGVEEQFYLIWPALLLTLYWFRKFGRNAGSNDLGPMLAGLALVFGASFMLSIYWTSTNAQSAFYLMPPRIWQFSLGAMIYLVLQSESSNGRGAMKCQNAGFGYLMLGIGLTLIFGSALALNSALVYPGYWALLPSIGAASVIGAGHFLPHDRLNPLGHPILVWLGDRSYSLYLWHWPIYMLGFSMGFQGQMLPALSMVLLSLLAAILSYRLIELPFWKGRLSHVKPSRTLLIGLLIMSVAIFALYYALRRLPNTDTNTDLSNQWRMDYPVIYRMPCDAWYAHSRLEPCIFGSESAEKTVVFLGDSIGAQWFSMIPEIFPIPRWRIIVLTKSSCPMVDEDFFYQRIGKIYQVCTDWRNAVLDELDKIKPEVVVLGSASTYPFTDTQWIEGSFRILERISNAATSVFVIPGIPSLGFDGPGCVARHLSPKGQIHPESCEAKDRMKHIAMVSDYLAQATKRLVNVNLLDLNDLVCPKGNCNAVSEKGVVYRDNQHLTDTFVKAQIPLIRERIHQSYQDLE